MAKAGQLPHRERKNGASREAWEKRKDEANAARPKQLTITLYDAEGKPESVSGPLRENY